MTATESVDGDRARRRFFLVQIAGVSLFNCAMNFSYTWWLWIGHSRIGMFDGVRVAFDLAGTPAVIAFLSTSLGTGPARKFFDRHPAVVASARSASMWRALPRTLIARTILAALVVALLFSLPLYVLLSVAAPVQVRPIDACIVKVGLTLLFSTIIVPCVLQAALADCIERKGMRPSGREPE